MQAHTLINSEGVSQLSSRTRGEDALFRFALRIGAIHVSCMTSSVRHFNQSNFSFSLYTKRIITLAFKASIETERAFLLSVLWEVGIPPKSIQWAIVRSHALHGHAKAFG